MTFNSTRPALAIFALIVLTAPKVHADGYHLAPADGGDATVTKYSAGVGVVSGGMALATSLKARGIRKSNSVSLLANAGVAIDLSDKQIHDVTAKVKPKDELTLLHTLNEADNRVAWIEKLEIEIAGHNASAVTYTANAAAALLETANITDHKGNVIGTRPAPNVAASVMYGSMAASEYSQATAKGAHLVAVRNGAAVPFLEFEKVIDSTDAVASKATLTAMDNNGQRIISVASLPEESAKAVKKMEKWSMIAVTASAASFLAAGVEFFTGYGSELLGIDSRASDRQDRGGYEYEGVEDHYPSNRGHAGRGY